MTFTSKKLQQKKGGMGFIKGATLFFLWVSCVLFVSQASFQITPITANAVNFLQKIFLTPDGFNTLTPTVFLDGTNGNWYFSGNVNVDGTVNGTTTRGNIVCLNDDPILPCRSVWPTPGGSTYDVQFNDNNTFSGQSNFVRDAANGRVWVNTSIPDTSLHVIGMAKIGGSDQIISWNSILSSILWGDRNTITYWQYNTIIWGYNNSILGHRYSYILGWMSNVIDAAQWGIWDLPLTGGKPPMFETIINGQGNEIHNASHSLIAWWKSAIISGYEWVFLRSDSVTDWFTAQKADTFLINATNGVGIGTNAPQATLDVNGGVRIGNDPVCIHDKVWTMRYRYDWSNCSYMEMCMEAGRALSRVLVRQYCDVYNPL